MSASPLPALDAVAVQLAASLQEYESATARMLATWPDLETYRELSGKVEQIRQYCAVLPQLRIQWAELLIAHAELVHSLWRVGKGEPAVGGQTLEAVRERHAGCIASTRARCARVLQQPEA